MVIYALYFCSKNHDQKECDMYNIFVNYIDKLSVVVYNILS